MSESELERSRRVNARPNPYEERINELEFQIRMNEMKYLERIEELESSLKANQECSSMEENKPVAYWDGKHFASKEKSSLADIPLYTAPHHASDVKQYRELSDDEIGTIISQIKYSELSISEYEFYKRFAKAILKKASEK